MEEKRELRGDISLNLRLPGPGIVALHPVPAEKRLSAYQFTSVYKELGYDLGKLGCIMLDVDPEGLEHLVREVIPPDQVFQSEDPSDHADGIVAGEPHLTLLYGLLRSGPEMKKQVLNVLNNGRVCPPTIQIDRVGFFDSPRSDLPYYCIVAHVAVSPGLQECNERLKFLPHIDTFPGYSPHITLAYIKENAVVRDQVIEKLNPLLQGRSLATSGLNFGVQKGG